MRLNADLNSLLEEQGAHNLEVEEARCEICPQDFPEPRQNSRPGREREAERQGKALRKKNVALRGVSRPAS